MERRIARPERSRRVPAVELCSVEDSSSPSTGTKDHHGLSSRKLRPPPYKHPQQRRLVLAGCEFRSRRCKTDFSTPSELQVTIDVKELNRRRLIGNLERIVLTLVVAAGSYSALGFLVAAKGLVRFGEFEKGREFTEYFLVRSLSSVAGSPVWRTLLRHALLALWTELSRLPDAIPSRKKKSRGGNVLGTLLAGAGAELLRWPTLGKSDQQVQMPRRRRNERIQRIWRARRDSNSRPTAPEAAALSS